jgi:hypothetical protein
MGESTVELPMEVLMLSIGAVLLIFLVLLIALWVKLNKLRKNYKSMLNGQGTMNIEQILMDIQDKGNKQAERTENMERSILQIQSKMKEMKSNIGIYRYNAFAEGGSDFSFSIAILDDHQSGVVITGIHNREQVYVYAKPMEQGQSKYTLSPEEKEAITRSGLKK